MNYKNAKRLGLGGLVAAMGALTFVVAGTNCGTGTTTTVAYTTDDPYLYTSYYPVDTAYAGYYYSAPSYYLFYYAGAAPTGELPAGVINNNTLNNLIGGGGAFGNNNRGGAGGHAAGRGGAGGTTAGRGGAGGAVASGTGGAGGMATGTGGAGGASAKTGRPTIASIVAALGRGETVCAGQVTVTPRTSPPACADGTTTSDGSGATIMFNGCVFNGATINGTFDITASRTASDQTCTSTTNITLNVTTTLTNISISDANGKIDIPMQTDTGKATYTFGQTPTSVDFTINGEMQFFDASNAMKADLTYNGMQTVTTTSSSYSVDGTQTVKEKTGGASATITEKGVTRSSGCCRPTGGTVTIDRTGGSSPGTATWTFGPSCGSVMRDNTAVTLPACI